MPKEAMIFDIQSFSLHDGPGIRTAVFMKGCNLKCFWCHNPESWNAEKELQFYQNKCISCGTCADICRYGMNGNSAIFTKDCILCAQCVQNCFSQAIIQSGYRISVSELMGKLIKEKDVFEQSGGGVTFSGGEPFLQTEFLLEALRACKKGNIDTAVESALCIPWERIESVLPYVDLIICDIKTMDENLHLEATGKPNNLILQNIIKISNAGANMRFRTPIIPGFNDTTESMNAIALFIKSLGKPYPIELLPFHGLCSGKYTSLNQKFRAEDLSSPSNEKMKALKACFENNDITVME